MLVSSLLLSALAAVASAKKCTELTVPITITSRNGVFDLQNPTTKIEATDFFLNLSRQGTNYTETLLSGYKTISGTYKLAATYCEPNSGPGHTLQILTHGIGFDRSYWDIPYDRYTYSYVNRAVDSYGYSTLTWDRLGVGKSSKGNPVNEIQVFLEVAALKALTEKAASGALSRKCPEYENIVHAGHSFGAAMTYDFANQYPKLTKGIILQGFSQAPGYLAYFALGGNFVPVSDVKSLKKNYPAGYFGADSTVGVHINFFGPKNFDPRALDFAYENQQAFTPGEVLTIGAGLGEKNKFTGPVLIITGDYDVPFCGGNCRGTMAINGTASDLLEYSRPNFPSASVFKTYIVPQSGHGLNFEYTYAQTYKQMLDFFKQNV